MVPDPCLSVWYSVRVRGYQPSLSRSTKLWSSMYRGPWGIPRSEYLPPRLARRSCAAFCVPRRTCLSPRTLNCMIGPNSFVHFPNTGIRSPSASNSWRRLPRIGTPINNISLGTRNPSTVDPSGAAHTSWSGRDLEPLATLVVLQQLDRIVHNGHADHGGGEFQNITHGLLFYFFFGSALPRGERERERDRTQFAACDQSAGPPDNIWPRRCSAKASIR